MLNTLYKKQFYNLKSDKLYKYIITQNHLFNIRSLKKNNIVEYNTTHYYYEKIGISLINLFKPFLYNVIQISGIGVKNVNKIFSLYGLSTTVKTSQLTPIAIRYIKLKINYRFNTNKKYIIEKHFKSITKLLRIKCYRGSRHFFNLPTRGQRTHTNRQTQKRLSSHRAIALKEKKDLFGIIDLKARKKKRYLFFKHKNRKNAKERRLIQLQKIDEQKLKKTLRRFNREKFMRKQKKRNRKSY